MRAITYKQSHTTVLFLKQPQVWMLDVEPLGPLLCSTI